MTNELAAVASNAAAVFVPGWAQELTALLSNIAVIAIPFVLWFATLAVEKRRATLALVRQLDRDNADNLERLYKFRRYQQSLDEDPQTSVENPYRNSPEMFSFDSVVVLNFYEAICTEIQEGALLEHLLYRPIRNSVIGARQTVLGRYSAHVGSDQSATYEALVAVADRWVKRANSTKEVIATKIPDAS